MTLFHSRPTPRQDGIVCCPVREETLYQKHLLLLALIHICYSMLIDLLPAQFVMSYDYDFLFHLRTVLSKYIVRAKSGYEMYAHSVAEELVVRLIRDLSFDVVEEWMENRGETHEGDEGNSFAGAWGEWPEDLCDDVDFETYLNDSSWLEKGHTYHFDDWFTPQFYLQRGSEQAVDSCACAS